MWRFWVAVVVALLGPFQFGVALTITSTMLESLSKDLGFDENLGGAVVTGALFAGATVGSIVAGPFERSTGKWVQVWLGVVFLIGALLCGAAIDSFLYCGFIMATAGRFLTGTASGIVIVVSSRYLAEASPIHIRGALVASMQLVVAVGFLLGTVLGLPYEFDEFDVALAWWRAMFLTGIGPAGLQTLLPLLTFPLFEMSNAELRNKLLSNHTVDKQEDKIEIDNQQVFPVEGVRSSNPSTLSSIDRLGIGIPVAGMFTGLAIVAAYSTSIFEEAGLNRAVVGSIIFGCMNVVSSGLAVELFDRWGRRTMAAISLSGMALSYLGMAFSSLAPSEISGPLMLVFIMCIFAFGIGCGSLSLSYAAEVLPEELVHAVMGIGQSMSFLVSMVQTLIFPSMLYAIGVFWSFFILSSTVVACLVFMMAYMIETKGRELKDIVQELTQWEEPLIAP